MAKRIGVSQTDAEPTEEIRLLQIGLVTALLMKPSVAPALEKDSVSAVVTARLCSANVTAAATTTPLSLPYLDLPPPPPSPPSAPPCLRLRRRRRRRRPGIHHPKSQVCHAVNQSIAKSLLDSFPDIKRECAASIRALVKVAPNVARAEGDVLLRNLVTNLGHQHSKTASSRSRASVSSLCAMRTLPPRGRPRWHGWRTGRRRRADRSSGPHVKVQQADGGRRAPGSPEVRGRPLGAGPTHGRAHAELPAARTSGENERAREVRAHAADDAGNASTDLTDEVTGVAEDCLAAVATHCLAHGGGGAAAAAAAAADGEGEGGSHDTLGPWCRG